MEKFIDKVVQSIMERALSLQHLTVIVPSERMIGYFQQAFFTVDGKPKMAPKIVTIDRWIQDLVDEPVLDKTRLVMRLFDQYIKDPVAYEDPTFDSFLKWGQLLLSDFEEIDRYLVDPKQLFKNLKDVRELENWSFNQENLSQAQLRFIAFWEKLGPYYHALEASLKETKHTTKGKVYRTVAENIDLIFKQDEKSQFVFAGFNALSLAELRIMKQLFVMGRGHIFMDSDQYYLADTWHEAGSFLRVLKDELQVKELPFVTNVLATKVCAVQLIECPQVTGQAKVVGTLLGKLSSEQLNETLVLLADEQLIVSLLQQLPASIEKANITLGLPLRTTSLRLWVDLIFKIQETNHRRKRPGIYFKDAIQYMHHPFVLGILTDAEQRDLRKLEDQIVDKNRFFLTVDDLAVSPKLVILNELLFASWNQDWALALSAIQQMNAHLDGLLEETQLFEKAIIRSFSQALIGLQNVLNEPVPVMNLGTFKQLFNQHWSTANMAYFGNPIDGLQIMGLLETRGLDFKRIIVLGLNEGTMPPTNPIQTLIPMDLRKYYNLPTPREKQGLFAHHFYRLLHHAEELYITYATAQEKIGSNEPSRFIQQIELELARVNPNFTIEKLYYTIGGGEKVGENIVQKTPVVIERMEQMLQEGITFSKLNTYLQCPLNFYYRYVLRIGEVSKMEESIESNTLGTIIHEVMEFLLKPYAPHDESGKQLPIVVESIAEMKKQAPRLVDQAFQEHFSSDKRDYETGTNYISYVMANEIVQRLLQRELDEFEDNPESHLWIKGLEHEINLNKEWEIGGKLRTLVLQGIIDRIDQRGEMLRLIDYKSGAVALDNVQLKKTQGNPAEAITKRIHANTKSYHLQLLMYAYLYQQKHGVAPEHVGIVSFVNTKDSPHYLTTDDGTALFDLIPAVEEVIVEILNDLFDATQPFKHDHNAKYCMYCN